MKRSVHFTFQKNRIKREKQTVEKSKTDSLKMTFPQFNKKYPPCFPHTFSTECGKRGKVSCSAI